jgi:hypothetical protein
MHTNAFKLILKGAAGALAILSFATAAHAQTINLTAGPSTATMPDGTAVPMWGYTCGTAAGASCAALNPTVQAFNTATTTAPASVGSMWSPVVITVPYTSGATSLTINLTNHLSFASGATTANTIPTSIVMIGQVGGGLGTAALRTTTTSPSHATAQECPSWFIAANPPGTPCTGPTAGVTTNTPPSQANRVQSFAAEVSAVPATATATCTAPTSGPATGCGTLTWKNLRPGTYLLESGTHPSIQVPMGLLGVLVVTAAPASGTAAGTAYPGVPANTTTGIAAIPAVQYNAELALEFSEIDPVQNAAVSAAVNTAGFLETNVWSGITGGCGNLLTATGTPNVGPVSSALPTPYGTCYPPAVNYTPFYFLINGVAFNKSGAANSLFPATAGAGTTTGISGTGTVLARLVNAGLRMHVPSIVNSLTKGYNGAGAAATVGGFTLIAEDGNPVPGVQVPGAASAPAAPRVQTDVFMAAGKTFDVMFNVPASPSTALPIFARDLGLSADSSARDAGMIAYIGVNGAALPVAQGTGALGAAQANADTFNSLVAGQPLSVTDLSKGVIANDVNVFGVTLLTPPTSGSLSCSAQPQNTVQGICRNGTFIYTPSGSTATPDSFTYCANTSAATIAATGCPANLTAKVTLGAASIEAAAGIKCNFPSPAYTAQEASYLKVPSPGVLAFCRDGAGYPLKVAATPAPTLSAGTVIMDPNGGFNATLSTVGTTATSATLTFSPQNSQGTVGASQTVTVNFPVPSNLTVHVVDSAAYLASGCSALSTVTTTGITCNGTTLPFITDYRWIIEEDDTFWVDPNCTTNSSTTTPGCAAPVATGGTIPTFGTNFHASWMNFVAQGCTGPLSCEGGQTMLDTVVGSPTFGTHIPAVCDLGNGACRPDPNCSVSNSCLTSGGSTAVLPSRVRLDPTKRYYISILPGDAANPYPSNVSTPTDCLAGPVSGTGANAALNTGCGHTMSGAPIPPACNILGGPNACTTTSAFAPVLVKVAPTPLPTGKLSVIVFEDDYPLNGEQDGGGGNGTVAPLEPGLGGFELVLWDTYGGLGDFTGQDTHDMFNQPLSNALAGTIDPSTGLNACPVSAEATGAQAGITGRIVTCPKFESDNVTLSPLAGQALISNLMPDKFSVQAYPGADRIARGEEWIQTNTLDGQHPHDAFIRIGEPGYFQEFGPSGFHVSIGFANPAIINSRYNDVCKGNGSPGTVGACTNTITGQVDVQRLSRTPDQRLYPSGTRDALAWTQCWVSLGDPDGEDFMFTKCDANGNFAFKGVPGGQWRLTIGDQWNDQIIDGLSYPANVGCTSTAPNQTNPTCPGGQTLAMGNIGVQQWQSNLYTRYFVDDNKNGIWDPGEIGVPQVYTRIKYRNGSNANALLTDPNGVANFNETFPLFNWYVVEPDLGRYKRTGTHTVYDAGGPADGSSYCGTTTNGARACGTSTAYNYLANTNESIPLPTDLSVPGAVYCKSADCTSEAASFALGTAIPSSPSITSTGRIDPPWVNSEGWSGMTSNGNWIDFGVTPYAPCPPACASVPNAVNNATAGGTTASTKQVGENGGIHGHVTYAATRPFDDASQMIEQPWAPNIPNVTLNLYQEGFAADGVTPILTLVDTTVSSSWDAWAQGFYPNSTAGAGTGAGQKPYISCPGQGTGVAGSTNQDLFFFSLYDQPEYLDYYNFLHTGAPLHTLPYNAQFKCYDSMHIWNQLQPAPYDGFYQFPSSLGVIATTGKPLTTNGSTNGVPSSLPGTNCTVCVGNPDSTDKYRVGTPMLPPGKYVVEVVMPAGYEVYKEEDKNLLIGDNFIAPTTVQFPGLGGSIFIIPDQASVASLYEPGGSGFNGTNYQNSTTATGLNEELSGVPGTPGFQDPVWPCVGEMRVVPDYLSLFPQAKETAPFAGATRPLCDRKEVTLSDQMNVSAKFFIFTSTHIAAKFTGVITNDFTAEFDPFSPQFGEKFSPPNMPVSTKDYLGNEISRVYADHWGTYESLNFSSWDVNPPNITGYSPSMMVQCMNDAGPILDTTVGSATYGQLITDPLYNPAYSQFCYEEPYMPGLQTYLDTPVVPTQAFVGAAYNDADCAYPDTTPAIAEVDGDAVGPWVSATGARTLTITALGNVQVENSGYSGPSANIAPYNLKKVQRHYGFGAAQGTGTAVLKPLNGTGASLNLSVTTWTDTTIVAGIPGSVASTNFACPIQQQTQYGGSTAYCGQLVITAANGKQSIDTVTVTVGGKKPTHVATSQTIQSAIDAAAPGDLIIVDPTCTTTSTGVLAACSESALRAASPTQKAAQASHNEMLLMWKPVRLQGVGAATSVLNANANPAGKLLDPWRRHINCLFGLTLQGVPMTGLATGVTAPAYDPSGTYSCPDNGPSDTWNYFTTPGTLHVPQIDRIPLESVVGWDATLNGNLAEQLQEPSLMGAYEGAGITVLGKGVWTRRGENVWTDPTQGGSAESAFPADALLLQDVPPGGGVGFQRSYCNVTPNPYPSNFECNPSSIDGISITNSSQGGGGIFIHSWAHNLQIANNRVYNNAGTLSGGISVGQGEFPEPNTVTAGTESLDAAPPSCVFQDVNGLHLPFCLDTHVNLHNNFIASNASLGDELFSGTLSGGGGVTFCSGADYYKFQYNWVCGNLSSGEGGGVTHLGFSYDGDIEHNTIVLNQSSNPTIPTNGGGIMIQGTPDTDPTCGDLPDADCPAGLSDGTGPALVINANLIQGNSADSGSGGGIRLNQVNGTDISTFPTNTSHWNGVSITNNIINNNVSGWDGAGISLQDSLNVKIVNNTIAHNDSLATSGVLTYSIGTPQSSAPAGVCVQAGPTGPTSASCPQPAGVSTTLNSSNLTTSFTGLTITCPTGQPGCAKFSNPILANNIIYQNRSFYIGITGLGTGTLNQQNLVALFDAFTTTPAPVQTTAGQCVTPTNPFPATSYWDVGVRGDTGPTNHGSGNSLNPTYSVLTSATGYSGTNSTAAPTVVGQYCNGTRVPPTCTVAEGCGGPSGYGVPPGIVDATSPNPVFSLTPAATVDEGNNWINVSWGPLAVSDPSVNSGTGSTGTGNWGSGPLFANYNLTSNFDPITDPTVAPPATDFNGNPRPASLYNPGAVEYAPGAGGGGATATLTPTSWTLSHTRNCPGTGILGILECALDPAQTFTLTNTGTVPLTGITQAVLGGTAANDANYAVVRLMSTCGPAGGGQLLGDVTLNPGATCNIVVQFKPLTAQPVGLEPATISVTDAAGTQTATLNGTAQ